MLTIESAIWKHMTPFVSVEPGKLAWIACSTSTSFGEAGAFQQNSRCFVIAAGQHTKRPACVEVSIRKVLFEAWKQVFAVYSTIARATTRHAQT